MTTGLSLPQRHPDPGVRAPHRRRRTQSSILSTAPGPRREASRPLPQHRNLWGMIQDGEESHSPSNAIERIPSPHLSGTQMHRPQPLLPQILQSGSPAPSSLRPRSPSPQSPPSSDLRVHTPAPYILRLTRLDPSPFLSPQKAVVARRLRSKGGAHLLQIPWQAGYVTP